MIFKFVIVKNNKLQNWVNVKRSNLRYGYVGKCRRKRKGADDISTLNQNYGSELHFPEEKLKEKKAASILALRTPMFA